MKLVKNNKTRVNKPGSLVRREDGHIIVKNIMAYFLDDIIIEEEIHGTIYIVDGSYEGSETLPSKLKRIMLHEEKKADDE